MYIIYHSNDDKHGAGMGATKDNRYVNASLFFFFLVFLVFLVFSFFFYISYFISLVFFIPHFGIICNPLPPIFSIIVLFFFIGLFVIVFFSFYIIFGLFLPFCSLIYIK